MTIPLISVDPLVGLTGQAYGYVGGSPVNSTDPRGLATIGVCGGGNLQLGFINVGAEDCLTRTVDNSGEDNIGLVAALQGGPGVGADLSVGGYYQISNATNLQELSGPFVYATVGGQLIGGTTVTVFWNGSRTHPIYGIDLGVSAGLGADVATGLSYTRVLQLNNWIEADIARAAWDSLVPGAIIDSIVKDLSRARTAINTAQKCP